MLHSFKKANFNSFEILEIFSNIFKKIQNDYQHNPYLSSKHIE